MVSPWGLTATPHGCTSLPGPPCFPISFSSFQGPSRIRLCRDVLAAAASVSASSIYHRLKNTNWNNQNENKFKGCGMSRWLVLVSPCFRKNVVATCKIGRFLCSLDYLLQKNVIVLFFGNLISKWRSFEKRAIFDLLFTFFSHQGKVTNIPSAHISLTYIHVFCSPYWPFLPYQFWKKYEFIRYGFSSVWVLVLILIRAILEQSINSKFVSTI